MTESTENISKDLFVRSIPFSVTEDQLGSFFSDFAPVKHAIIVKDKQTGSSKGFGFVSFGSTEDAVLAKAEASKVPISENRLLLIDVAKPRVRNGDATKLTRLGNDKAETEKFELDREKRKPRLLVRNCPWSLRNPQELVKIFSRYGKVVDAYIPRGENNKMTGFAFVTMKRKKHAKIAIEESKDPKIHDRPVNVSMALEKNKWLSKKQGEDVEDSDDDSDSDSGSDSENENNNDEIIKLSDNEEDIDEDEENDEDDKLEEKSRLPKLDRNTVFVRNIPYDADSESLKEHFEQFGPVAYALPVMDKIKNVPKGVAFVAFNKLKDCEACCADAPQVSSSSLLVPDDVDPRYVYEGRVLNVTKSVGRDTAGRLAQDKENERLESMGRAPRINDKRRLFLLNEGRIGPNSKLAQYIPKAEMEIREKSYKLRKQQLTKNPSLHLSMTRLAIRNLPRSMDEKALKSLGRKAVVEFATEVKEERRQPLSKEELMRSIHYQNSQGEPNKKHGVVKQSKIIKEVKGTGDAGRSRGYGFLEMRNHKAALMALRWLNGHLVSQEELEQGNNEVEPDKKRRLVVEFAIENAQVLKRQKEQQERSQKFSAKRKAADIEEKEKKAKEEAEKEKADADAKKIHSAIGRKRKSKKMKRS